MQGIQIQYLLGIYFTVVAISWNGGSFTADALKLIAGILLIATAVLGLTLI